MKAWENQTPLNKHIKLLKVTREHLWQELVANPLYSEPKVKRISRYIEQLNKKIAKRSLTDEEVQKLVSDVKVYSRNYKRIAARKRKPRRPKMTPGAIKFVLKQTRNEKKAISDLPGIPSKGRRAGVQSQNKQGLKAALRQGELFESAINSKGKR